MFAAVLVLKVNSVVMVQSDYQDVSYKVLK